MNKIYIKFKKDDKDEEGEIKRNVNTIKIATEPTSFSITPGSIFKNKLTLNKSNVFKFGKFFIQQFLEIKPKLK
jgi:hypothetical protein